MMNHSDLDSWITGNYGDDNQEQPVKYCTACGEPLYPGDTVYNISGECLCLECMKDRYEVML